MSRVIVSVCLTLLPLTGVMAYPVDSLQHIISASNDDSIKVDVYLQLHQRYMMQNDSAMAMAYVDSACELSRKSYNQRGLINSLNAKSTYFLKRGQSQQALDILLEVSATNEEDQYPKLMATTYNNLGLAHYQLGSADEAIKWHHKAATICEETGNEMGLARAYNNLGISYQKIEDWQKALIYHRESLRICERLSIEQGIAYNLGNIGIIQNNLHQYDSALISHRQSLAINQKSGDRYQEAINYNNMAVAYESLKMTDSALYNHEKALSLREQIADQVGILTSLNDIAALQTNHTGNLSGVEKKLLRALALANGIEAKDFLRDTYLNLSILYEKTGKANLALDSRKQYEAWKDSTVSENHLSRISELEMKYESQKKESEILALSQENMEKQAGIDKQNLLIKVMTISIVALVVVSLLLFIIYKQSVSNKSQRALLNAITETQERERIRIARDLHDSVGIMLTAVKHKLEQGQPNGQVTGLIDEAANEVRRISHNMMPGALLKYGLASAIEQLLSDTEQLNKLKANLYTYGLDERIGMNLEIGIYRIIQELVQNIIRHADASHLTLHINKHQKHVNIIIEDDGKGMNGFDTVNDQREGIGLKNIRSRVAAWKGDFSIDSENSSGTTILINIPLQND
jgi:signal transduction histidine kinase